jgi:hypothetical protein
MRKYLVIISPQTFHRAGLVGVALSLLAACGGAAVPQPVAPGPGLPSAPSGSAAAASQPAATVPAPADPFAVPAGPRDDESADPSATAPVDLEPWKKTLKAKGASPPPPSCAAYVKRAPSKERMSGEGPFGEKDPAKRDALFVAQEKAPKSNVVALRALRADLAPIECADVIVDPLLGSMTVSRSEDAAYVRILVGLSLAGKLARTASAPPAMGAIRDKEKVKAFVNGPLKTWLVEQSTAIELLSSGAAGLSGYARGIAAIEAGVAELRLVDKMRSAPVPATWDPQLKAIYEAALDEALEPRKKRGRDAALVGMSDFARVGILRDARLDRARALLTKLYGGRRIDALDGLLLPAQQLPPPTTPSEIASASVPTAWLEDTDVAGAQAPLFLSRGVTRGLRDALERGHGHSEELITSYARARLAMGRVYWRRVDFVEAAQTVKASKKPEDRLTLALALALAQGPNGAAEMMRAPTPAALDLRHTEALDALVAEGGPMAGMAAYDAAHLRALSPPEGAEAVSYLKDVAARFRKAETLLSDPVHEKVAAQRAAEIDAIVTSLK